MTVQEGLQAMKLQDLKNKKPADLLAFAEELEIENASSMRKQDMLFAILKELAERNVEIMGQGVVETLQDGFGFLRSPESNYLPGPDDIYVSPVADPPLRPSHRRHGGRPDPRPQGWRALFRAAQGHDHQFRRPRADQAQGPFRQSDAALSHPLAEDGAGRSHHQGQDRPRHRHRRAPGHGPARPDHRPAAHRQDRDPAEYRQGDFGQSSGNLPDRASDRRTARKKSPTCSVR